MVSNLTLAGSGEALDSSLNTIYSKFLELRQEEGGITRSTATPMTLNPGEGASKNINNYGRLTASAVDFGVDLVQAQALADTPTSYTPGEIGVQVILSGQALRQSADRDLYDRTGRIMHNAWDIKEDSDGVSQFSSFTPSLGGAGTVASPGLLEAVASRLRIGNDRTNPEPAEKPWYCQVHPLTATPLRGRIAGLGPTPDGATAYGVNTGAHVGTTVLQNPNSEQQRMLEDGPGTLGMWAGMIVKENSNISVDSSDDAINAGYSKEGMIFVTEVSPRMDPDDTDKSMRGAIELNLWGSHAWGLYRSANKGVQFTADASLPTS